MWYLSFDIGTKSFAYALVWLAPPGVPLLPAAPADLPSQLGALRLAAGAAHDLTVDEAFPRGRPDASLSAPGRVALVVRHLARVVAADLARHAAEAGTVRVLVEYQMGPNANARTVASAVMAYYAAQNEIAGRFEIHEVKPTLKNRVAVVDEGRYPYFIEKYRTAYAANKNHAKFNLEVLEKHFGALGGATAARPGAVGDRSHVADAVMQVLGFLLYAHDMV